MIISEKSLLPESPVIPEKRRIFPRITGPEKVQRENENSCDILKKEPVRMGGLFYGRNQTSDIDY